MKKGVLITILVFLIILMGALGIFAYYYISEINYLQGKFLYNTYINDMNVSLMTPEDVNKQLFENYYPRQEFTVTFDDSTYEVTNETFDFSNELGAYKYINYIDYNKWMGSKLGTTMFTYEYSDDILDATVDKIMKTWNIFDQYNWVHPEDAYITMDIDENWVIVPDIQGNMIDLEIARDAIREMITNPNASTDLSDYMGLRLDERLKADDESLVNLCNKLNDSRSIYYNYGFSVDRVSNLSSNKEREEFLGQLERLTSALDKLFALEITFDYGGKQYSFTGEDIREYIYVDWDSWLYDFNKEACVNEYVSKLAVRYNTMGLDRKFWCHDGSYVEISGGDWGWWLNQNESAVNLAYMIDERISGPCELVWIQEGGTSSSHNTDECDFTNYVECDLTNQKIYVWRDGECLLTSDCVSGCEADGNMTPSGIYSLTFKKTDATLVGDDYEVKVAYWMPFNGGIGLHDATWKSSFGGTVYKYNGTHGCIGLPLWAAEELYGYIDSSYAVVVYWR